MLDGVKIPNALKIKRESDIHLVVENYLTSIGYKTILSDSSFRSLGGDNKRPDLMVESKEKETFIIELKYNIGLTQVTQLFDYIIQANDIYGKDLKGIAIAKSYSESNKRIASRLGIALIEYSEYNGYIYFKEVFLEKRVKVYNETLNSLQKEFYLNKKNGLLNFCKYYDFEKSLFIETGRKNHFKINKDNIIFYFEQILRKDIELKTDEGLINQIKKELDVFFVENVVLDKTTGELKIIKEEILSIESIDKDYINILFNRKYCEKFI